MMKLTGSCHCGAVRFSLMSAHPYPFNKCYCSICVKTNGSGGYGINISGDYSTLSVQGEKHISIYQARMIKDGKETISNAKRHFCKLCSSGLFLYDDRWPDLASAIDTPLPEAPEHTHLMMDSKVPWVQLSKDPIDKCFAEYPEESIAQWHERLKLTK